MSSSTTMGITQRRYELRRLFGIGMVIDHLAANQAEQVLTASSSTTARSIELCRDRLPLWAAQLYQQTIKNGSFSIAAECGDNLDVCRGWLMQGSADRIPRPVIRPPDPLLSSLLNQNQRVPKSQQ